MHICTNEDDINEYEPVEYYYLQFAIAIPTILTVQYAWFFRTIYYASHHRKWRKASIKTRILYITLQVWALIWTTNELIKMVINPPTGVLSGNIGCDIAAWINRVFPQIYYILYLYQVLLRLDISIKGSYLQLSRVTYYILLFFTFIPTLIAATGMWLVNEEPPCHRIWRPADFPKITNQSFGYCTIPINDGKVFLLAIAMFTVLLNILFGVIFVIKLKRLLSDNEYNVNIKINFKRLIAKITILTVTGAASTVISYGLLSIAGSNVGAIFVYLDTFVNVIVIGLMFPHNEMHYKRLCKCCILVTLVRFDKSRRRRGHTEVMRYVNNMKRVKSKSKSSLNSGNTTPVSTSRVNDESDTNAGRNTSPWDVKLSQMDGSKNLAVAVVEDTDEEESQSTDSNDPEVP